MASLSNTELNDEFEMRRERNKELLNKDNMNKRHRWATEIIAWAEGKTIECRAKPYGTEEWSIWHNVNGTPSWSINENIEYRVKDPLREIKEAYAAGKTIQSRYRGGKEWDDIGDPQWFPCKEYRVKPEPEYEPYTFDDGEKLIGKAVRSKATGTIFLITRLTGESVYKDTHAGSYKDLMDNYTYLDGSVLGNPKN